MTITQTLDPPSDQRLDFLEGIYRIKWPEGFRSFLQQANGGVPESDNVLPGARGRVVERFLCVTDDPKAVRPPLGEYDIAVVATHLDERLVEDEDALGLTLIPFAALFAGDFLCLDYRRGHPPKVVVWDHELSDDLKPHTEDAFDTFSDFLSAMGLSN